MSVLLPLQTPQVVAVVVLCALTLAVCMSMRPKRFYFVRHGQTLLNAKHIKQGAEGGLSELGKHQAAVVGASLSGRGIHLILSSPYERAQESAQIINQSLHVAIRYSPLLAERRNPTEVLNKATHDSDVERIVDQIDLAYHADDYRFSDEENFTDLKKRARRCLSFLEWRGSRATCVITHHAFLKMLVAYALYREALHAGDFVKLSFFNISDNAGITVCEFHPWQSLGKTRGWRVLSYNEALPE